MIRSWMVPLIDVGTQARPAVPMAAGTEAAPKGLPRAGGQQLDRGVEELGRRPGTPVATVRGIATRGAYLVGSHG